MVTAVLEGLRRWVELPILEIKIHADCNALPIRPPPGLALGERRIRIESMIHSGAALCHADDPAALDPVIAAISLRCASSSDRQFSRYHSAICPAVAIHTPSCATIWRRIVSKCRAL